MCVCVCVYVCMFVCIFIYAYVYIPGCSFYIGSIYNIIATKSL